MHHARFASVPSYGRRPLTTLLLAAVLVVACEHDKPGPPSSVKALTSTAVTSTVGTTLPPITVQVLDVRDHPVEGAKVQFSITQGDGSIDAPLVITDAEGVAQVTWTLSRTAGENALIASVFGTHSVATFEAMGVAGPAVGVSIYPHTLRIPLQSNAAQLFASVVDQYGNAVGTSPSFTSRDPSAATVDAASGAVTRQAFGASTYVIATNGAFMDSSLVILQASSEDLCSGSQAVDLALGEVMTSGFVDGGVCLASGFNREFALVPFFDFSVPSAMTTLTASGLGVSVAQGAFSTRPVTVSRLIADRDRFDAALRAQGARELQSRATAARAWFAGHGGDPAAASATGVPHVGDRAEFNTNADGYCSNPRMAVARVVAVTQHAIVYADTANPSNGFTDAELASLGVTFDTLAYASDVANFGEPTDIDGNGRVILLFTKDVSSAGVLGLHTSRDLLPKSGSFGACPGSNVAEMLYMRVPDTLGIMTPAFVKANTPATLAHEFQHAINAGRRLYVNSSAAIAEEFWLDEGLSHIAEELAFFRGSGLAPRQNIESVSPALRQDLADMMGQNFARFKLFMQFPSEQSPVGSDPFNDLPNRGAAWSLLRYLADHKFAANESAFWFALENANTTGMDNLRQQVGPMLNTMIRDWTISNWMDDLVPAAPQYQQPTWNLRKVMGIYLPSTTAMTASVGATNATSPQIPLRALSSGFIRFAVPGQEAYVWASGAGGRPLASGVRLAVVRTR